MLTDEQIYSLRDDELLQLVAEEHYTRRIAAQAENGPDAVIAYSARVQRLLKNGLAGIMEHRAFEFDSAFKTEDYRLVAQIVKEVAGVRYVNSATQLLLAMTGRT